MAARREAARRSLPERPPRERPNAYPEIDCVRNLLPAGLIAAAERRAAAIGLGADRVLIAADAITEDAYLAAFARSIGVGYARLDEVPRTACPLSDDELIAAGASGLLRLRTVSGMTWVVAPRCLAARRLPALLAGRPELLPAFRVTSEEQLRRFVVRHARDALGRRAADGLRRAWPLLSSAPRAPRRLVVAAAAGILTALAFAAALPVHSITIVETALCLIFLAGAALRMSTVLFRPRPEPPLARGNDDALPIYTVICALYREANVVEDLVAAIRRLAVTHECLRLGFFGFRARTASKNTKASRRGPMQG